MKSTERSTSLVVRCCTLTASATLAAPAFAHHPMGGQTPATVWHGFASGVVHPVIGPDHFVFLLVAGALLRSASRRFTCEAAAILVGGQLAGTLLHVAAINVPVAEAVIALSVVVAGATLFRRRHITFPATLSILGIAGLFHGYAYGESIVGAQSGPLAAYLIGLALIQALVVVGVARGSNAIVQRVGGPTALWERAAGGAAVAAGAALLALAVI